MRLHLFLHRYATIRLSARCGIPVNHFAYRIAHGAHPKNLRN
jgi:hypothetical protein